MRAWCWGRIPPIRKRMRTPTRFSAIPPSPTRAGGSTWRASTRLTPAGPDLYGQQFQAHANTLKQTTTVGAGDVDPADGLVHIRFAFAPVLDKPYDHVADHQPYVYVSVRNVTKSLTLFERFIFASQTDIPWKEGCRDIYDGNWVYLDWQVVDVAPGAANLAVGDQIALEVTVAGCQELAHGGYVYVDGFGSESPGLSVSKTAPATAQADTDLIYVITYRNGSGVEQTNVQVVETLPVSVTYVSDTGGCSHASGVVTCDLGTVAAGGSGTITITTHILAGTPVGAKIVNGNYIIKSDQTKDVLGMSVETEIVGEHADDPDRRRDRPHHRRDHRGRHGDGDRQRGARLHHDDQRQRRVHLHQHGRQPARGGQRHGRGQLRGGLRLRQPDQDHRRRRDQHAEPHAAADRGRPGLRRPARALQDAAGRQRPAAHDRGWRALPGQRFAPDAETDGQTERDRHRRRQQRNR